MQQIIELRITMRYIGINIICTSYTFGDNKLALNSFLKVNTKLHKQAMHYSSIKYVTILLRLDCNSTVYTRRQ